MRDDLTERALEALRAELPRVNGDMTAFDPERPMRDLMDAGFTPDESSHALDKGEEELGFWAE
jgi:hypothetical protein